MKKIFSFILFAMMLEWVPLSTRAQEMPKIIPPSPNAQTFTKYEEYPVSNYTGVPDITIPIYTIKLKDISVPISLSYNASGIQVNEEASRVGLGWALNAGGIITHTIMGKFNDFDHSAYFNDDYPMFDIKGLLPYPAGLKKYTIGSYWSEFPYTISTNDKYIFWRTIGNDNTTCETALDLAPDIFSYNFMAYSGKFIFSRNGEIIKERQDDNIIVKLTSIEPNVSYGEAYNKLLKSWEITTPDGVKYYFQQTEECQTNPIDPGTKYNSSFYLTRIETISGTVVNFDYIKKQNAEVYNKLQSISQDGEFKKHISCAKYDVVYLDKITYSGGEIKFNYLFDREDLPPEARLDNILINNTGSNPICWKLEQEYFTTNKVTNEIVTLNDIAMEISTYSTNYYNETWKNKRLKLKKIYCTDNSGEKNDNYIFSYNETELPSKLSSSQDHWGYYNGSNNFNLIPDVSQDVSQEEGVIKIETYSYGANREPSEQLNQAFLLNKIVYPTGGETEFTYETNKYKTSDFENDPHKRDFMYSRGGTSIETTPELQNAGDDWNISKEFSISTPSIKQVPLNFNIWINKDRYNSMLNYTSRILHLSLLNSDNNVIWNYDYDVSQIPQILNENYSANKQWSISLGAGNYKLKASENMIFCIDSLHFSNTFYYYPEEFISAHPVGLGGGIRIKEIKSFDSNGNFCFGKQYRYTIDGSSSEIQTSGKLMFYPRYKYAMYKLSSNGLRGGGFSVGYSKVTILDIDNMNNLLGKKEYTYINYPDKNLFYTWKDNFSSPNCLLSSKDENPGGIGAYKFAENGTVLNETYYKNGNKLKETINTYNILSDDGPHIIWGVTKNADNPYNTYPNNAVTCWQGEISLGLASLDEIKQILIQSYSTSATDRPWGYLYPALRPLYILLDTKTEINYENGQAIEATTKYSYNSKNQLSKEELVSQNKVLKTMEYIYPIDKSSENNMQLLINANRINLPVETRQIINNNTKLVRNDYSFFNSIPQISSVLTNTSTNQELETRIIYHNYDNYGNPLYITRDDADKVVYLWSYNGQYPIAEIKNASLTEVTSVVTSNFSVQSIDVLSNLQQPDETKLKDGSLQRTLPNAFVTTYTYYPLVGIHTITDPREVTRTYEYDLFNRLKYIKDKDDKIIQSFEYNYKH